MTVHRPGALAIVSSVLGVVATVLMVAYVQPAYAQMYDDFGVSLEPTTRQCLKPWVAVALSAPAQILFVLGAVLRRFARARKTTAFGILVLALVLAGLVALLIGLWSTPVSVMMARPDANLG